VLVVLTREHGKLRFLGKGVKRSTRERFAPAVDLLEFGDIVWAAREEDRGGLLNLTDWSQRCGFVGLRDRLERLYPALYAGEATSEMLLDGDPHTSLFDALVDLLREIESAADGLPALCAYQRTLLAEVGLIPQLMCCVACGRTDFAQEAVYFSSYEGGFLCRDCEPARVEKRRIGPRLLRALGAWPPAPEAAAGVFELLDYHITEQLGRPLRLASFVLAGRRPRR
jgi:DNA repair protein RecO